MTTCGDNGKGPGRSGVRAAGKSCSGTTGVGHYGASKKL